MNILLNRANIVIVAKNHNPSIATKDWIKDKGLFTEEIKDFVNTPAFSLFQTDNYFFTVDPDRLMLELKMGEKKLLQHLPEMVNKYICNLSETPYTALGFNLSYTINSPKLTLDSIFPVDAKKFESIFSKDYEIGGHIKSKFSGFNVKINLYHSEDKIFANFNFHFESNIFKKLVEQLELHSKTTSYAENVLEGFFNE